MQPCPLVVLPGWGHDKRGWKSFRGQFPNRRVEVIDLPGFGDEPLVSPEWGILEYAEWVKKKIESLQLGRVVLIGHSFGGRIAGLIASEQSSWLAGLVLYGAPLLYRPTMSIRLRIALAKIAKPFLKPFVPKQFLRNPDLQAADKEGMGTIFRRIISFDETDLLPRISVPTLLVWGERDTAAPLRIAQEAHTLIPKSELSIIPHAGHNVHLESPTLFYGVLSKFLTRHAHDFSV